MVDDESESYVFPEKSEESTEPTDSSPRRRSVRAMRLLMKTPEESTYTSDSAPEESTYTSDSAPAKNDNIVEAKPPVKDTDSTKTTTSPKTSPKLEDISKKMGTAINIGKLAVPTALKIGANATGGLAKMMDTMRQANKAALNVDALGTKTTDSALNVANKVANDTQSVVSDVSDTVNSTLNEKKKMDELKLKIPNFQTEMTNLQQAAIEEVGGKGVRFEDMAPEDRAKVADVLDRKVDEFLRTKIGDDYASKLDKNSAEGKIIRDTFREMRDIDKFTSKDTKNENREKKLDLKKDINAESEIKTQLSVETDKEKREYLTVALRRMKTAKTPEDKKFYQLAAAVDPYYVGESMKMGSPDAMSDSMLKKMESVAWDRANALPDGTPEKEEWMNVIWDIHGRRMDTSDDKKDLAADANMQQLTQTLSPSEYLLNRNRGSRNMSPQQLQMLKDGKLPADRRFIKQIQREYLPMKRDSLVARNLIATNGDLVMPWDSLSDEDKKEINDLRIWQAEVDNALIMAEVDANIDNLIEAKTKSLDPNLKQAKIVEDGRLPEGYSRKDVVSKVYGVVLQEQKDNFKAVLRESLDKHLQDVKDAAANGQDVSKLVNNALMNSYKDAYDKVLVPAMQNTFGLYNVHTNGSVAPLTATELNGLILDHIANDRLPSIEMRIPSGGSSPGGTPPVSPPVKSTKRRSSPKHWDDEDTLGVTGAEFMHGGKKGGIVVGGRHIDDLSANDLNSIKSNIDQKYRSGTISRTQYNAELKKINRAALSKIFATVASDQTLPADLRNSAKSALSVMAERKWARSINGTSANTVISTLDKISNTPNIGPILTSSFKGIDLTKTNFLPAPPIVSGGRTDENAFWKSQMGEYKKKVLAKKMRL